MNIIEIYNKFPTELNAVQHFEKLRWGKYVAEFVYKYNNRNNHGKMFDILCKKAIKPTS